MQNIEKKYKLTFSLRVKPELCNTISKVQNKTDFINSAIAFYIDSILFPESVLKTMKQKYPEEYKRIGRRKW